MLITEAMMAHYREQGYLIFEGLFSAEETDALREVVDRMDEERERELQVLGQQGISIPNQINFNALLNKKSETVRSFAKQERFVKLTTALLGPNTKLYWDQSVYKRPEAKRDFPWHQDTGYVPTMPEEYVTCWLALEDATIENGCVWVLPGTHKLGLVEHKETDVGKQCYFGDDPGIPVELTKGSMVAFNSLLFHRSTPNLSATTRKGMILQYSTSDTYNPVTGVVFDNGPEIARDGVAV